MSNNVELHLLRAAGAILVVVVVLVAVELEHRSQVCTHNSPNLPCSRIVKTVQGRPASIRFSSMLLRQKANRLTCKKSIKKTKNRCLLCVCCCNAAFQPLCHRPTVQTTCKRPKTRANNGLAMLTAIDSQPTKAWHSDRRGANIIFQKVKYLVGGERCFATSQQA